MCRWIAYRGEKTALERYVTAPDHSLIHQSLHALESEGATNGDGFGLGWYTPRETEPGIYREIRPAWSDDNVRNLCRHIRSKLFFAHIRASTGTATTRPNCHPFSYGKWMFMHNGSIGEWPLIRRQVEALIDDQFYPRRFGTTDSEAVFLAMLSAGLENDPVGATGRTMATVTDIVKKSGTEKPVRFTAALSDGKNLFTFRYASDASATSLYYRDIGDAALIVSEPLDMDRTFWNPVPANSVLIASEGKKLVVQPFAVEPPQLRAVG
jgi:predicted glutamine amidotransferase